MERGGNTQHGRQSMDPTQYLAAARRLGLKPTQVPNVWADSSGEVFNVPAPDPAKYTADQLQEIIEKLREQLGVGFG